MNNSILYSIKNLLGITPEDTSFDNMLIIHINSVFSILNQMGVGTNNKYIIEDSNNTWNEFIVDDSIMESVKTYIFLKVKLLFDPPLNSSILNSYKEHIKELEFRLFFSSETKKGDDENEQL